MRNDPHSGFPDDIRRVLEQMEFLKRGGIDVRQYVAAMAAAGQGYDLGRVGLAQLFGQATINIVRSQYGKPNPAKPDSDLILGSSDTGTQIGVPLDKPFRMLVAGSSGAGKSNLVLNSLKALRKLRIKAYCWEYKPELRQVVPFWPDVIILNPSNAPFRFLDPIGENKLAYYIAIISEVAAEFEVHAATVPRIWETIERMLRGMKPGDPPFSWEDLRRVLEHEAEVQKRENLYTAARAIQNICVVLGKQASARIVPEIPDKYNIIAYDFVGQDPAIFRLFLGFEFVRLLFRAQEDGPTESFRRCFIFDEGAGLFSKELMRRGVTQISAAKRFVSMCRFTGTGFIIGAQNLSQIDPFVHQNCDVLVVFRSGSTEDADIAAQMLGLPQEGAEDLMRLPIGTAFVRLADWQRPVKIKIPLFQP